MSKWFSNPVIKCHLKYVTTIVESEHKKQIAGGQSIANCKKSL